MFQFQIYPSGTISDYRTIVNSVSGVTAILDRQMGLIENSLSGVAFYVQAISNFINQNNVGTSGTPIVSGFFNFIGYTWFARGEDILYPFITTEDGIVSGVGTVYSSGVSIYDSTPDIKRLHSSSGFFYNVFFDDGFKGACTIKDFVFTDTVKNLYSGYIPADYSKRLTYIQPPISTPTTYPFNLSGSGILNDMIVRYRLDSSNNEFGIIKNQFTVDNLYVYNTSGVFTSGNLSILGIYKTNFNNYSSASPKFSESIFQLKSHRHNGSDSAVLDFSKFGSTVPVKNHFSLIQSSGNITVNRNFEGNSIGLASNWETVDIPDINNVQKLLTCKDKLYILDNVKLTEVSTGRQIQSTQTDYPRAQVIATRTGDTPALIELIKSRDYNLLDLEDIENVAYIRITPFNTGQSSELYFTYTGASPDFVTVQARKEIPIDRGIRIGGKLYISLMDTIDGNKIFSLYEIDTIASPMSMKTVAHYQLQDTDWRFIKPVKFKNSIYYFFKSDGSTTYVLVYNTVYRPTKDTRTAYGAGSAIPLSRYHLFEHSTGMRYGFNVFENVGDPTVESTGLSNVGQSVANKKPHANDYTYFMGKPVVCTGTTPGGFRFSSLIRNRLAIFAETGTTGSYSIISYAGKLWRGAALHIGRDAANCDTTNTYLLDKLKELTGLTTPWLMLPIIYHGWLYAIAPTMASTTWQSLREVGDFMWKVTEYLPEGSLIVRRRSSETDVVNMMAYSL